MALERRGNLKFKVIAYRKLQEIIKAGALGCELRITGKLPSERAKSWRFAEGYLKKAGESRKEIDRAEATALTKTGIIGVKVAIMNPKARVYDRIDINEEIKARIKGMSIQESEEEANSEIKSSKKKSKKASKIVKEVIKSKAMADKGKKYGKAEIMKKGETKVVEESKNLDIKPVEDGTAMQIEEEIEEGVPQEQIDKDIAPKGVPSTKGKEKVAPSSVPSAEGKEEGKIVKHKNTREDMRI